MVFLSQNRSPGRLTSLGERGGILAMGLLLGLVLFLYFLPSHNTVHPSVPSISRGPANVEAFRPDGQILAGVTDKTASDRSVIHADAIQHLLKLALNVTPDIAEALGMPDQQLPVDVLRGNPDHYRGRYLWYKGKLDYFEPTQTRHPVHGYSMYEGHLRIARQDQKPADVVFFYVSKPAAPQIKVGDFARIEGYFLKLRDEHLLAKAEKGPLLIGSQLKPDYPDWKAVEKLDLGVLGRVENAVWKNETWLHTRDVWLTLPESEDTPLWHLASFAMNQQALMTEEEIRRVPLFQDEKMLLEFKHGSRDQGTPVRIRGRLAYSRIIKADVNPIGIERWTTAWVQLPRLGGKTVPIWVTEDIGSEWRPLQDVKVLAYYFKNLHYRSLNDDERFTPLFVAAGIKSVRLPANQVNSILAYCFMGVILLLMGIIFMMYRNNVKQTHQHKVELVERRRRRRHRQMQEAGGQT